MYFKPLRYIRKGKVIVKLATIYQINCFRPLVGNVRDKFALLYNTSSWSFTFYAGFSTAIKYAIEIMELSCSANNSFREAPRAIKSRRNQRIMSQVAPLGKETTI